MADYGHELAFGTFITPELRDPTRARVDPHLTAASETLAPRRLDAVVVAALSGPLTTFNARMSMPTASRVRLTAPGAVRGRVLMDPHGRGFVLGISAAVTTPVARAARTPAPSCPSTAWRRSTCIPRWWSTSSPRTAG